MAVAVIAASLPPDLAASPESCNSNARHAIQNSPRTMNVTRAPPVPRGKRERPCDACRKRKSKCVVTEGQQVCAACGVHGQKCTYVEDPQPRKRRIDNSGEQAQKRSAISPTSNGSSAMTIGIPEADLINTDHAQKHPIDSDLHLDGSPHQYGTHIGPTTELEPLLLGLFSDQGLSSTGKKYQVRGNSSFYVDEAAMEGLKASNSTALEAVERLVVPHGSRLLALYLEKVDSSFPIIQKSFFSSYDAGAKQILDPALLATVFVLAVPWLVKEDFVSDVTPDLAALEKLAFTLFTQSLHSPTLSTIQAGILLMQRPDVVSKTLNTQLVDAAFELGLQVDCSSWSLSPAEKGLRKRLAWALYMQDKWCSLIHGRPSAISGNNWAVLDLEDEDFESEAKTMSNEEHSQSKRLIFKQMVLLTGILATVLDTFYSLKVMQEVEDAGQAGTRLILERAKPVQMRLKEWFGTLPSSLKIDAAVTDRLAATGYMHLAYFATEITLHRCIIRSLQNSSSDLYVAYICRSAAKTRLISAMDFVNRLRPEHLDAFWYFPSRVSFALIGTFGSLLLATAPCQEELEFYRTRLGEYRWTLGVSSRTAPFLDFAVESLDASEAMLRNLPSRPSTVEMPLQTVHMSGTQGSSSAGDKFLSDRSPMLPYGLPTLEARNSLTTTWGLASSIASDEDESE